MPKFVRSKIKTRRKEKKQKQNLHDGLAEVSLNSFLTNDHAPDWDFVRSMAMVQTESLPYLMDTILLQYPICYLGNHHLKWKLYMTEPCCHLTIIAIILKLSLSRAFTKYHSWNCKCSFFHEPVQRHVRNNNGPPL